jgi:hypothetical protein
MRRTDWKKRALLLVTISLTALFVTSIVPKNCQSIPFFAPAEHRSNIFIYRGGESTPAAGDILSFIGKRVNAFVNTGDERSLASNFPGNINDKSAIDFIRSIPEPSTLLILGSGMIGFAIFARKKFKK